MIGPNFKVFISLNLILLHSQGENNHDLFEFSSVHRKESQLFESLFRVKGSNTNPPTTLMKGWKSGILGCAWFYNPQLNTNTKIHGCQADFKSRVFAGCALEPIHL